MQFKSKLIGTLFSSAALLAVTFGVSGCNGLQPAAKGESPAASKSAPQAKAQKLTVKTQMSQPIKLQPVAADKKVVYLDIRNMSRTNVQVLETVKKALTSKGYQVTSDPRKATYMYQGNILRVAKADLGEAQGYLKAGYGGGMGAAAGNAVYVMVTDLQIRERPQSGSGAWKAHRTRIVSTANNGSQTFEQARPALQNIMAKAMTGML